MSKYEIGVRLHDYGCASPDEMLRRMTADGFTSCQLAYTKAIEGIHSYTDITPQTVQATKEAIKKYNVSIGVLGCYIEFAIDQEEVRLANVKTIQNLIPICEEVGAACIGFETTAMQNQKPETTREMAQQLLIDSLKKIMPVAEEHGVIIAIEPVNWHSMNTAEATKMVLEAVNSPNLKVIFDAGNILPAGEVKNQKAFWANVMNLIGDQIVAVHYKTQSYDAEDHRFACTQAENQIDWDIVFAELDRLPQFLPILREEQKLPYVKEDMAELRRLTRIAD